MRNQALTGYVLHHKPYQDKRALCYFFTPDYGMVHGISRRGLPLFECLQLFATGKRSLKNFTQVQLAQTSAPIVGAQQYAALYLNEILFYLLSVEDPYPQLWQQYQTTLLRLREPLSATELKLYLRVFELNLFTALGYEVLLTHDSLGDNIRAEGDYRYVPDDGFVAIQNNVNGRPNNRQQAKNNTTLPQFTGMQLQQMHSQGVTVQTLTLWSKLFHTVIDHLLDYRPLQSRLLWQQQQRYAK